MLELKKRMLTLRAMVDQRLSRSLLAIMLAYFASKLLTVQAFADDGSSSFMKYADNSGSTGGDVIANAFAGFINPMTEIAAVILVIATIVCGMKIGASAMVGDPRTRMDALVGIMFIVVGGVVVIHAKQIVGMSGSIQTTGQ
ncbi:hypothetical protein FOD75_11335 (plasmid) [Limosilactobacillus reuteri]|uniref:Uncharacterized protein n=1 Tax=Limosilactobacillus reuteri TaxID=1598 RepID=A0A517D8V3_LIMRT|nr:hypothetical protein [Limosilactobacillus reuteri]QDR73677.1 hypothetical protein FOD75_11335 [Limosilactobacillus reuteri]